MTGVLVEVPENVKFEFESGGINLEGYIKEAIESKAFELKFNRSKNLQRAFIEFLASKSKLTQKDALELGDKINEYAFNKLKQEGLV